MSMTVDKTRQSQPRSLMKSIIICKPDWDFQQAVESPIVSCPMLQNYPGELIAKTPASDCARLRQVEFPEQSTSGHGNRLSTVCI